MKKVNIILSTYNGEKYLDEQLQSLLTQTYKNIDIYIRDDGSGDRTVDIIKKYENMKTDGIRIIFVEDTLGNLGYVKSFLKIIRASAKADYYAFCDQDDYWFPDKIERAVKLLDREDSNCCLLYSSAYQVCDNNMKVISEGHVPTPFEQLDVGKALSLFDGGWLLGFTCVINDSLKNKAFDNDIEEMYSHDIWTQAVAVGFGGKLLTDNKVTVYFRRHNQSTSIAEQGVSKSWISAWKYRWDEVFGKGNLFERLRCGIISYSHQYKNQMKRKTDIKFLEIFSNQTGGFMVKLKKLCYLHRLKKSLIIECAWRLAILMGKI